MVIEELDLRPLAGVDHVLQRQRMQPEDPADLRDQFDIGEPDAVEPDQWPASAGGGNVVEAGFVDESRSCQARSASG